MSEPLGRGLESLIPFKEGEEVPDALAENLPITDASTVPPTVATEQNNAPESPLITVASSPTPVAVKTQLPSKYNTGRTYADNFEPRRGESIFWIELEKLDPNPYQPRREFNEDALKDLAGSIREHGILQPVLVTKREIETPQGLDVRYQLIAGERRMRAAKLAGLSQIPAVVRRGIPDDRIKLELAIIENVQREDLNAMERARAFRQLMDEFHLVHRDIAARVGKSREYVVNTLRLLALAPEIQKGLGDGQITEGHARTILMVGEDAARQNELYTAIVTDRLSVRGAESKAREMTGKKLRHSKRPSQFFDPEARAWQSQLQDQLGTRVVFQRMGERGKIVVEFYSEEELRGIIGKLIK